MELETSVCWKTAPAAFEGMTLLEEDVIAGAGAASTIGLLEVVGTMVEIDLAEVTTTVPGMVVVPTASGSPVS